jgi:uncharacterized membrane protein
MKTLLMNLPDEKAQKELKQFAVIACILSGISLVAFWFLGIVGIATGARALVLSYHRTNRRALKYRVASIVAILAGIVSLVFSLSR